MSQHYVFPKVQQLQDDVLQKVQQGEVDIDRIASSNAASLLADLHTRIQARIVKEWWALAEMLVVRYNDQYFNFAPSAPTEAIPISYPSFWLQMTGFNSQSYYPGWMKPS